MLLNCFGLTSVQGLQPTKRDGYGQLVFKDIIMAVNGKNVSNGSDAQSPNGSI